MKFNFKEKVNKYKHLIVYLILLGIIGVLGAAYYNQTNQQAIDNLQPENLVTFPIQEMFDQ